MRERQANVDERTLENMLRRVLQRDFSAGTETFRDTLLARCLEEIDAGDSASELDDADLGMLAAAGGSPKEIALLASESGAARLE